MSETVEVRSQKKVWARLKAIRPGQWISIVCVAAFGFVMLYPMYFALLGSVSTNLEFKAAILLPIPKSIGSEISNYLLIFQGDYGIQLLQSLGLTTIRIAFHFVITVVTSVLGGYVYAKIDFPFKRTMFMMLLASMMIPGIAMMVPSYVWMAKFPLVGGNNILGKGGSGFIGNLAYLFIPGWINVYNIFLCRQAFYSMGDELSEAAQIDGADFLKIVFVMYMPMIKPILAVMFLNLFLGVWNDYLTNIIYLNGKPEYQTTGYAFIRLINFYLHPNQGAGEEYPKALAITIISMIPPIIVYTFLQKAFVSGLSLGGVKG